MNNNVCVSVMCLVYEVAYTASSLSRTSRWSCLTRLPSASPAPLSLGQQHSKMENALTHTGAARGSEPTHMCSHRHMHKQAGTHKDRHTHTNSHTHTQIDTHTGTNRQHTVHTYFPTTYFLITYFPTWGGRVS